MAITVDFSKKYAHLICTCIPKNQIESYPSNIQIPEKYRQKFIHPEDGFVKLFCEEYGKSNNDERVNEYDWAGS